MDFSDHSNRNDKVLQQIIQKGLLPHIVFTTRKLSYPLYGESVLRFVKLSCNTATHIVHRTIFSGNLTMFFSENLNKIAEIIFRTFAFSAWETICNDMVSELGKSLSFLHLQAWHFDSQNAGQRSFHSLGPSWLQLCCLEKERKIE